MGDVVSEVLPHLESFFHDHCLIVLPASKDKELTIYYCDYVGEISFSESQYFYSVRSRTALGYTALGSEHTLSGAINRIYVIMSALRKAPAQGILDAILPHAKKAQVVACGSPAKS